MMRKLIITEEERNSILNLHGIFEQTTPQPPNTGTTQSTTPKPMYGTPEQRVAAAQKRKENRQKIFDNLLKGAYNKNFYVVVSDDEFADGCSDEKASEIPYIEGTSPDFPDYVYRELMDGTKIKFDIKGYRKELKRQSKKEDVGLEGMQGPEFKATSCGISKAATRQSKQDWKKK